jgi:hypothetical protein
VKLKLAHGTSQGLSSYTKKKAKQGSNRVFQNTSKRLCFILINSCINLPYQFFKKKSHVKIKFKAIETNYLYVCLLKKNHLKKISHMNCYFIFHTDMKPCDIVVV